MKLGKVLGGIFVFALLVLPLSRANAARFGGGDSFVVPGGETVAENLYAGGGTISLDGSIKGDAFLAGGTVNISGSIVDDVAIASGNVNLGGQIGGDARVAGGTVNISGQIGGDALIAAGQVLIVSGAKVAHESRVYAGNVLVQGTLEGPAFIQAEEVTIAGTVNQNINIRAERITIKNTAVINGHFSYSSPREAKIEEGSKLNGGSTYTKMEFKTRKIAAAVFSAFIIRLLMTLVLAAFLYAIFKDKILVWVNESIKKPLKNLLVGFLYVIAVPVLFVLVMITVIGMPVAMVFGLLYIALLITAKAGVGILLGSWLEKMIYKKPEVEINWWTVCGGVIVSSAIAFIPVIGWFINLLLYLLGLGAFVVMIYEKGLTVFQKN